MQLRTLIRMKRHARRLLATRRGVTGILSMMFLVMFGSLAVAMAVVSQGNLRTAETHIRVSRALGAVDTGMEIAAKTLDRAAARCVVGEGQIDGNYATALWTGDSLGGTLSSFIDVSGYDSVSSIMAAVEQIHEDQVDTNIASQISPSFVAPDDWYVSPAIGLDQDGEGNIITAVQIAYITPSEDEISDGRIRVVVTGYDWDWTRGQYVTRTAQQYFDLTKEVKQAVLAPSRIMIGRNVQVDGPLGARFSSTNATGDIDGPPLVVKSDFYGLDGENGPLTKKLEAFYDAVLQYDVDGDNRLRTLHATESQPLAALNLMDFSMYDDSDNDTDPDYAYTDMTADNIIDEYDIFLRHYDTNGDGMVALPDVLSYRTPNDSLSPEFELDNALAYLIDAGLPDRNGNGRENGIHDPYHSDASPEGWIFESFDDNNGDGLLDMLDVDSDDVTLGYRDGVLDYRDRYAKIRGTVAFRTDRATWEDSDDGLGGTVDDYQGYVQGSIVPDGNDDATIFEASDEELPEITPASFAAATAALVAIADDEVQTFAQQVAAVKGGGFTPPTVIESTPYGSPAPADWYERPVYEGINFKNVTIPMGTNALFIDCTFAGVTKIEAYQDNTHDSWQFYGKAVRDPATGQLSVLYPPPPAMSDAQLDKSYSDPTAPGYENLPEPLIVSVDLNGDGVANDPCTDTKRIANNIRFHDCLFVGSIVAPQPTVYRQLRNKVQFTGATRFTDEHPTSPSDPSLNPDAEDLEEIAKSSLMLPNYSVDIGTNNSPPEQDVQLQGAIIAGVIDIRGNAKIDGVILATFNPTRGQAPLTLYGQEIGNPADFNITLGYFGPEDGDDEGIDLASLTDLDGDGNVDIGWDSARDPATGEMIELSGWDGTHDESWYDGVPDEDADISPGTYVTRAITFNGFGKVELNYDPDMVLPDGLAAPIAIRPLRNTYREGRFYYEAADPAPDPGPIVGVE